MHPTRANGMPLETSKNNGGTLCFCMPTQKAGLAIVKTLRLLETPYKPLGNEWFYSKVLHNPLAGAKWTLAPQPDSTRGPFKNHWKTLCF